jgi:hypothetical protein
MAEGGQVFFEPLDEKALSFLPHPMALGTEFPF